jgi:hypothetical protein
MSPIRDPNFDGALSTVNFVADFTEQVMLRAGTTAIRGGTVPHVGTYWIEAGSHKFAAKTKEEAFNKLMRWLLFKTPEYDNVTTEQAAEDAVKVDQQETEELLNALAEGGMSEFGRAVEEVRKQRTDQIKAAMVKISEGTNPTRDPNVLISEIAARTGIADLAVDEVLAALRDLNAVPMQRMKDNVAHFPSGDSQLTGI